MSSLRRQSSQSVLANTNGYLGVTQHPVQSGPLTRGRSVRARKHRTAYDDSAIQMSPAGVTMYNCREIMELILRSCDWRFLMVFSRLERYSRAIVQYVARMMLKDILCLWVEDVDGLLRLLETTGGGITGSVARMLMEVNSERMRIVSQAVGRTSICRHCHDLNIIVPTGQFPDAVAFFKQQGFSKTTFPTPDHPYVESVLRFAICQRPRSGTRPPALVTISESNASLMAVVLASPVTAQANLVTASRVYCVYPHLMHNACALKTDLPRMRFVRRPRQCYVVQGTNSFDHLAACGNSCVAEQRKTIGDKGTASFLYNPSVTTPASRDGATDYLLAENNFLWRFSSRCTNKRCKNWTPCSPPHGLSI